MPLFFFHIRDGVSIPDEVGTELADWRAAQIEAIRLAGQVVKDSAAQIKLGEDWSMLVTAEDGLVLFSVDFHISGSPVISRASQAMGDGAGPASTT